MSDLGKKISALPETTDLNGLFTIGTDKNTTSKKVSLQFLKEAATYANAQGDYAKSIGDTVAGNVGSTDYPVFSASGIYAIGDVVRYNDRLYRFTAPHQAGSWTGADVELTSINEESQRKLTELESYSGAIKRKEVFTATFASPWQAATHEYKLAVGQKMNFLYRSANETCQLTIKVRNADGTNIATIFTSVEAEKITDVDYDVTNPSDSIVIYSNADGKLIVSEYVKEDTTIPEQFASINAKLDEGIAGLHGNFFTEDGKYIDPLGNFYTATSASVATEYIPIDNVEYIKIRGRSGPYVALIAFYDENKSFISSIYGNDYNNVLVTLTENDFPAKAKYFRATGNGNASDVLIFASLRYLFDQKQGEKNIGINVVATMGASLMYSGNGWVEKGCGLVGAKVYNKAVSGEMPPYFANQMYKDTYCTEEEFENTDVLVMQFSNAGNVYIADNSQTIEDYESGLDASLSNPFTKLSYAQCIDYILKKWQKKCYDQRNNDNSKWYGTQHGKPCNLLFVTHWHDGRKSYNESIRQVAEKWGAGLCALDRQIGFSRKQTLFDNSQVSVMYAVDTETIDNVVYGWHPLRGENGAYIQKKMANIFAKSLTDLFAMNL